MKRPKEWVCPRCQQANEPDDRFCFFCKADSTKVKVVHVEDLTTEDLYVEIAAG